MKLPTIFELASNSYIQLNGRGIINDLSEKKKIKQMKETEELILTKMLPQIIFGQVRL